MYRFRMWAAAWWLGLAAAAGGQAPKSQTDLGQALIAARHSISVGPNGLAGEGAALLGRAVGEARYVAIGEDHFTREIPLFASAICDLMGPQGLAAYVVEAGPVATDAIAPMLTAPDRAARMAAFAKAYPNAVAFLDGADENDTAAHCAKAAGAVPYHLIGIDQEFLGAGGFLLDEILKSRLSATARRLVTELRDEDRKGSAAAAKDGNPGGLLIPSAAEDSLARVEAALRTGGDVRARRLFGELKASHEIYALDARGSPEANGERARMMKRHLAERLPARGKVLLKFGDWHLYKGVNPLEQRDIGNFIAERAEGEGARSLHILVLAARGSHGQFAGYARQAKAQSFVMSQDKDYRWFGLAVDRMGAQGWTLFDLRTLRHRRLEGMDADW